MTHDRDLLSRMDLTLRITRSAGYDTKESIGLEYDSAKSRLLPKPLEEMFLDVLKPATALPLGQFAKDRLDHGVITVYVDIPISIAEAIEVMDCEPSGDRPIETDTWVYTTADKAIGHLKDAVKWLGPQSKSDIDAIVAWHHALEVKSQELLSHVTSYSVLSDSDYCSPDPIRPSCCSAHEIERRAVRSAKDVSAAADDREFSLEGDHRIVSFPSGAKYPHLDPWVDFHEASPAAVIDAANALSGPDGRSELPALRRSTASLCDLLSKYKKVLKLRLPAAYGIAGQYN